MRILHYKATQFDTAEAATVCDQLEAALGVALCVHDAAAPNAVHGHLNTDSDGNVEVVLYEAADVAAMEAIPDVVRFAKCEDCGAEHNDWTDPDVCEDCGADVDFTKGRAHSLRAHKGIYRAAQGSDRTVREKCETVLKARGFALADPTAPVVRQQHHAVEAHERAATKDVRKIEALARREIAATPVLTDG